MGAYVNPKTGYYCNYDPEQRLNEWCQIFKKRGVEEGFKLGFVAGIKHCLEEKKPSADHELHGGEQ